MSQAAEEHGAGRFRYGGVLLLTLAIAIFALDRSGQRRRAHDRAARRRGDAARRRAHLAGAGRHASGGGLGVAVAVLVGGIATALGSPHPALTFGATAFLLALTAGVILAGLVRLVVERGVVLQAVLGALAVYMLVGLTFAFLIGALATGESRAVLRPGHRRDPERARLLQLHRAHDDGVRRLHRRHARRAGARGARDAHRPALPGDGHRDAGGESASPAAVTCASSR